MSYLSNTERRSVRANRAVASVRSEGVERAYADWLRLQAWDHFATLTFSNPASAEGAANGFRSYVRHLESLAKRAVNYFASVESGSLNDRIHVHAVLAGTEALTVLQIGAAWRCGHATVRLFDPGLDGIAYVAKSLGEQDSHLILHDRRLVNA